MLHVCSPNDVHAAQALAAIERGMHVVCEKPLAVSTAESRAMLAAAEERGIVHATCYHARGYPLVEQMRAEVAAGATGEVSFVHGRYLCDDVLFPASGWRIDPARSGPSYVVGDLGTHWLDLAEHVSGQQVTEVLADFRSFAGGPLEDYAALLLRFSGGASGSLVLSAGAAGRKNQLLFELRGNARRPDVGPGAADRAGRPPGRRARSRSSSRIRRRTRRGARAMSRYPAGHGEGYGQAFRNLFENVYAAIEGRAARPVPDLRRRPPRRRDAGGRRRERPRRRLGGGRGR